MKKMYIYEKPLENAGGWVNHQTEKERISLELDKISPEQVSVIRYNLTTSPTEFVRNKTVDKMLNTKGLDILPITIVDDEVKMTGRYLNHQELSQLLSIS